MGLFNKIWSGLDFWDKSENQGQRQSFSNQDEEDRKRKQQQQAAATVSRPQPNTPGLSSTNTTVKPIPTAGSQSDFAQPKIDFTQPLNKMTQPTQPATPFGGVQTPQKVAQPTTPAPVKPPITPATTPAPQVPHPVAAPPNPIDVRNKATAYQNPNVQDVNNYYGGDLKVLNEELAKGDNADLHRVQGLMQSLDNRKKELTDFHAARADNASFKTARELGDTIKSTRGDWTKQNQQLSDFWNGVKTNETGDFEHYLAEKDPNNKEAMSSPMMMTANGTWKNGNGQNFSPDFGGDVGKVKEVQQRQQIADVANANKDIPLDQMGNDTIAMKLRDYKAASPEEQRGTLIDLQNIIKDNETNYSANPDLKRKADQAFIVYNTLVDSNTTKNNAHTHFDNFMGKAGDFGGALLESPKHVIQSVDALGRETFGGGEQRGDELTRLHDSGQISDEEYNQKLNENSRDTAWAGDGSQGRGHDALVALGTSADTVATFLPILGAAKGAKAAIVAEDMAAKIAAEQGISRTAARVLAKEALGSMAENGTDSLTKTMAKEAMVNAGFSGVGSLRSGEFNPDQTLKETAMGGIIGGVAPAAGDVLGKVGSNVLSKFRPGTELPSAVEDVGRVTTHLGEQGGADVTTRASLMSAEQQSRVAQLEQLVDDPNTPSYQKLPYKEELNQIETEVDKKMQDALGVPGEDPLDRPTYLHNEDVKNVIADEEAKLTDQLNGNQDMSQQEIEAANNAATQRAIERISKIQEDRHAVATAGMNNIPDPASPITLEKMGAGQGTANETGIINVPDNILPAKFDPAPLDKVAVDSTAETAQAPAPVAGAPEKDIQGNTALTSDATRARQLADQGMAPAVGASPVARGEETLSKAATTTAEDQVNLTNPTDGTIAPNQTAQRIMASPDVPQDVKQSISNLTHDVHDDATMINAAGNLVSKDINGARQMFDSQDLVASGNLDGHVHLGNALVEEYNRLNLTAEAGKVYDGLIAAASKYGQGLRATSAISKISPQSIIDFASRIASKNGKALTPELEQELIQTAKGVAQMAPGEEKATAIRNMIDLARQKTFGQKAGDFIKGVLSAPRGLMATGDLSFGIRQGGVLGSRYPKEWAEAMAKSAKYAVSPEAFHEGMAQLANLTDESGEHLAPIFKKMGLSLNAVDGGAEEQFGNTSILESKALKKVGIGHVVAGSDRAFSGAAAEMRANIAKKIIDGYGGVKALEGWTEKDLTDLGRVLNTATGRGMGAEGSWFEKAAPTLSDTLFSARLWKSRLDLLNPIYYMKLAPAARKVALQSSGSFAAVVSATLGAAAAAGASVEMDPRSSDFGKIKIGNTRYDIMGGLQQNIVLAARELSGQKKNSATGEVTDFAPGIRIGEDGKPISIGEGDSGFGGTNRVKVLGDMVTNKETPVLATATRIASGKDIAGNPVNPWTEIAKLFIPLGAQDVNALVQDRAGNGQAEQTFGEAVSNYKDVPGDLKSVAKSAPGFIGAGVQTYGGGQAQVGAHQGVDPTTLSPKDLKKYEGNVNKDFVKGLSKDEQRVYNLSKDDKLEKLAIDKGTVTQDQVDKVLQKENQALEKAGLPTNEPAMASKDSIEAHAENGDFKTAISDLDRQISANEKSKDVPKSKNDELKVQKKQLQVTMDGHFHPDIIKKYSSTSVSDWRAMTDPESDQYDPETAGQLLAYDNALTKASVSGGKNPDLNKYSAKKGGSGGGGGSHTGNGTQSIATNKIDFANFTPQKMQSASNSAPTSSIPVLQKVPNYSRTPKKISTSKGVVRT